MRKQNGFWLLALAAAVMALWLVQPRHGKESANPAAAAIPGQPVSPAGIVAEPYAGEVAPRHPQIGFRTPDRLAQHFHRHGREFHVRTAADYLRLAQALRDRPRGGDVLELVRNDAVTCKFDRSDGSFVAYDSDGTIRSFFRPRDGEAYFERQRTRAGDRP